MSPDDRATISYTDDHKAAIVKYDEAELAQIQAAGEGVSIIATSAHVNIRNKDKNITVRAKTFGNRPQ